MFYLAIPDHFWVLLAKISGPFVSHKHAEELSYKFTHSYTQEEYLELYSYFCLALDEAMGAAELNGEGGPRPSDEIEDSAHTTVCSGKEYFLAVTWGKCDPPDPLSPDFIRLHCDWDYTYSKNFDSDLTDDAIAWRRDSEKWPWDID